MILWVCCKDIVVGELVCMITPSVRRMEFNVTGEYGTRDVYAHRKVDESRRRVQGLIKVSLVLSF